MLNFIPNTNNNPKSSSLNNIDHNLTHQNLGTNNIHNHPKNENSTLCLLYDLLLFFLQFACCLYFLVFAKKDKHILGSRTTSTLTTGTKTYTSGTQQPQTTNKMIRPKQHIL